MLLPRIIPCLLVRQGGLVKTTRFTDAKYVGDPINAVRIFNEKEVDELIVLDIDASVQGREPNVGLIGTLASECRMPLCYGGGVKTVEHFEKLVSLGVEKVAISSAAIDRPELVRQAACKVGSQSVVVVFDVMREGAAGAFAVWTHNGTRPTGGCPGALAARMQDLGAGEIVVNSIDRDGSMKGYERELVAHVRGATSLPLTVLGGAGSLEDIGRLVEEFGIIGAAAGSLFVFKGPYRAVLINYPNRVKKDELIAGALSRARA